MSMKTIVTKSNSNQIKSKPSKIFFFWKRYGTYPQCNWVVTGSQEKTKKGANFKNMCPLSKTSKFNVKDMINYSLKLQKCSLKQIVTIFDKKCLNVEKFCLKYSQKTWIKQFINVPLSKKVK